MATFNDDIPTIEMNDIPTWDADTGEVTLDMTGGDIQPDDRLQDLTLDEVESRFLSGQRRYVISSNVEYFQFFYADENGHVLNLLYVGFKDGSLYQYAEVTPEEALVIYRAASPGGAVWDHLRVRGSVFGFQKPYQLVTGTRLWNANTMGRVRHGAVGKSGEPYRGWHPTQNFGNASGQLGPKAVDLGKRRSPRKIAAFTPTRAAGVWRKRA